MISNGVSVVICCYNGANRLRETIRHLARQSVPPGINWEVILVNNASTDDTVQVALNLWNEFDGPVPFKVENELNLGLSYARVKGFESAAFNYIILCDDDNWLKNDYVVLSYEIMSQMSNVACLGGLGVAVYEAEPPDWIKSMNIYATGPQSNFGSGKPTDSKLHGAGMVIRKSYYQALKEVGFRNLLTDRKGHILSSGGDHELCYAFLLVGYELWYDERLYFRHFITKDRFKLDYFIRFVDESSMCFEVLEAYKYAAIFRKRNFLFLVVKDFLFYSKIFIEINLRRILAGNDSLLTMPLYLRSKEFRYKIKSLIFNYFRIKGYYLNILKLIKC